MTIPVTVRSIARFNIISLDKANSAREEAAEVMLTNNVGSVVVSESGNFVGIVTERDLIRKVVASEKDPSSVKIEQIMSRPPITIYARKGRGEGEVADGRAQDTPPSRHGERKDDKNIGIFTQRDLQQKITEVFRSLAETEALV